MLSDDQRNLLRKHLRPPGSLTCRQAQQIAAKTNLPLRKVEFFALEQGVVPQRYDRNIGTLGLDGQRKLLASCTAVVGLGGLGGHVVEMLARLGVGQIVGIDGDTFVESNLNRQLFCSVDNVGRSKADQARRRVAAINPAVEFTAHETAFESLGEEVFRGCGLVFDCLDSIPSRLLLAERCASADVVLVHGAIAGWSGQVGICPPGGRMLDKLYAGKKRGLEKKLGNLGFTAAVAANLMVAKATLVLLGRPTPSQQLQLFDLLDGEWETIDLIVN